MKRLFTLFAALLLAATVWAQSGSPKMSYQAVVRNADNELVTNQTGIIVEVSILQADTVAYKETHNNVKTNQNGLLSLRIGDGTVNKGSLNDVDWTKAKISTSINLGGETVSATAPVTAVPYALYADAVNPNSEFVNNIQENITEIQGDITEIQENYLTKAGLCDSIKSCPTITEIQGDITDIQGDITTIQSNVTNLTDNYLTKAGLCDSIKNCPTITEIQSNISEIKGDINNLTDDYLTKAGLCDSIKNCPTITEIQSNISEIEGNITNITDDYLTKAGLCDSIKSCPTIKDMDNSISENKAAIEAIDGRIRTDSLEIVELYASTMESVLGKIKTDSSALAGQIATNANQISTNTGNIATNTGNISTNTSEIASIKENYLTKAGLCDSIKSCPTIKDMDNSISENKAAIEAIDGRIRTDSLEIVELYASTMETVLGKIKTDSSALAGQIATNANQIATNTSNIATNTGNIATNTGNISTNTSEIASIKENYLTIDGLCDSIKNKCGDFATKTDLEAAVDTLVSESALTSTLANYYTQEKINDTLNAYYDTTKIKNLLENYEIKTCEDVAACVNTALSDAVSTTNDLVDSIVDEHIKLADSLATKTYVDNALSSYVTTESLNTTLGGYYTKSETYSQSEVDTKFDTLANYALISQEKALTFNPLTNADSAKLLADTTLTIPTGSVLDTCHLVKLYINGVYVGDNADGVLVVTDKKKVRYDYTKNGDYKLAVGDRIKILYWVKKN